MTTPDRAAQPASRAAAGGENRLIIHNVGKTYRRGRRALDSVTLSLGNGLFGLLGPNGAGKSTLMRSVATLQRIDTGSIRFNDIDTQQDPGPLRAQLGYLPQDFGVYPGLSAVRLLDYLAIVKGFTDARPRRMQIDQLLERTGLFADRHAAVSEYSGGMRQRFGIAQALLGQPRLLVVDEPTAGLDPSERNRFHQLLCGLSEQMVVLLSTHIVDDVRNLCRQMAVLDHGRLRFSGTPEALVQRLRGRLWTASPEAARAAGPGCRLLSTRIIGGAARIRVSAEACPGAGFETAQADLEDGYFHVLACGDAEVDGSGPSGVDDRDGSRSCEAASRV
ncbi:ATP-binding cassette domain-containing protein [Pseudomarimonas salicorniae]|uniref:ATP-binding cassette domain-containing protein n=1 Tax=Pseudomarimonas salicorniae TaxID=2933270 RepID=A0ABT0GDE3_9GAMM|nr:ATP-binding cassette domain-containing protein [Lysobacter sp. CAU 1642]MCK7592062.1 ATP-binding cassette domain-containing protein [Lysobacter sp. CAU 1642]